MAEKNCMTTPVILSSGKIWPHTDNTKLQSLIQRPICQREICDEKQATLGDAFTDTDRDFDPQRICILAVL
ncbi:MAG: hypothetical protein P8J91_05680 [Pirellulaceae bacterium]|nr:hypothetical protein [Pirellulaceae bacterium]